MKQIACVHSAMLVVWGKAETDLFVEGNSECKIALESCAEAMSTRGIPFVRPVQHLLNFDSSFELPGSDLRRAQKYEQRIVKAKQQRATKDLKKNNRS